MKVRVRLAASKGWEEVEIGDGAMVRDLMEKLKYHPASIALINVNGVPATAETVLKSGDEIVLVPTVDGGTGRNPARML
ncbi:MAG: MoaD/ThiS family protein [Candidatus Hadarchaeales archaeon]